MAGILSLWAALRQWWWVNVTRGLRFPDASKDGCEWCQHMHIVYACAHCGRSDVGRQECNGG